MKLTVMVAGEVVDVELERTANGIRATVGDRSYWIEATSVEPGVFWLNWNQQSVEVFVTPDGEGYSVSLGSHRIAVEILDARRKLKRTKHSGHTGAVEIRAPLPGKIVRVMASEGGDVEINQGIVVMEAMKMQNEIKSPIQGKIQKLAVAEGATVQSGDLIAIVDGGGAQGQ